MRSVLFVDDDQAALEGLRLRLHRLRNTWRTEFVDSGAAALAALERGPFDVIVSDMRMPGMDGAQLLQIVHERWPEMARVVLSGVAQLEQSMRLVPIAHEFLSKPCDASVLENSIERCLALRRFLDRPTLRAAVGKLRQLPPIPKTYAQLQSLMTSETVNVREVADVISSDTIIAAKLLQMVNSAFFRLPRRITTVEQAVAYLGLLTVRNLVLSAEVFSGLPSSAPRATAINLTSLQKHALRLAGAVRALTAGTAMIEDALLAALLHDIGYWVLSLEHGTALDEAVQLAVEESLPLDEAEIRVLGASHAEIGAYLLGLWSFPTNIVEAVAHHHAPTRVPRLQFDVLAALSIAHALTEPTEGQAFANPRITHSEVDASCLEVLHAPFSWAEAIDLVAATAVEEGCEQ